MEDLTSAQVAGTLFERLNGRGPFARVIDPTVDLVAADDRRRARAPWEIFRDVVMDRLDDEFVLRGSGASDLSDRAEALAAAALPREGQAGYMGAPVAVLVDRSPCLAASPLILSPLSNLARLPLAAAARAGAGHARDMPNFKGSAPGRLPLVSADSGRATVPRSALEARTLVPERARAGRPRRSGVESPASRPGARRAAVRDGHARRLPLERRVRRDGARPDADRGLGRRRRGAPPRGPGDGRLQGRARGRRRRAVVLRRRRDGAAAAEPKTLPGCVYADVARSLPRPVRAARALAVPRCLLFQKLPPHGAHATVHAALAPELAAAENTGRSPYVADCRAEAPGLPRDADALADALWGASAAYAGAG